MQVTELTFGVEFEVTIPNRVAIGREVPGHAGWIAKGDCSIIPTAGYRGVEIVSPVLKGVDGINQVVAICQWLESVGAKVNSSTGFHCHVGFDRNDEKGLKRLIASVTNHEKAIYAVAGNKGRELNRYCKSTRNYEGAKQIFQNQPAPYLDRYQVLNLTNLINGRRPTVEFRAFAGTTNATKAIGFIRICLGLVEKATTEKVGRRFSREYPKGMTGEKAVNRLAEYLGWSGTKPVVYGNLETERTPRMAATTAELVRLARKYDQSAA